MRIVRLAIDVESGDFGPEVVISGVLEASKVSSCPIYTHIYVVIEVKIEDIVNRSKEGKALIQNSEIVHCSDKISTWRQAGKCLEKES